MTPPPDTERLVRQAARAIGRAGLAHAYGHCSARLGADHFLVCAAKPMGLIAPIDAGIMVPVAGPLPHGVLGEVRIHQKIYAARPDVAGIVRSMPPKTMALSTLRRTPRALHGMGAYFAPAAPLWDDPQLLRNAAAAAALAETLGPASAIVMRGNGLVTAAASLQHAVVLSWYFEDAARLELDILSTNLPAAELTLQDAHRRATFEGGILERMWSYLTAGDPEG